MAGGQGDAGSPGDLELDDDLGGVDPDEEPEAEGQDDPADEGDEAGGADGDGGEGTEDPDDERPQRQARDVAPPRREGRYQRLANENRELRTKVTEFERNLNALVNERRQPTQAEIAAEQERERQAVEMMTPAEVAAYYAQKSERSTNNRLAQLERNLFERSDKAEFDRLLETTPAYRRYEAKVDELKALAPTVERKILLATAIGMAAMEGQGRARTRATKAADEARGRQTARPSNGRGDVRSDRGRGGAGQGSFEHLRNVQI